jgi:hypothetical protein
MISSCKLAVLTEMAKPLLPKLTTLIDYVWHPCGTPW